MVRRLVTAVALAVLFAGLVTTQAAPAQAATYYNSRCGNTSGRVLLTFDDWAYGDPYRATRIGAHLQSRNIRAAFFLINQYAKNYPGIVSTLR
jgi:peptidoglycan/xylan/chitin deacetylase (PgdA/CDA1 family)